MTRNPKPEAAKPVDQAAATPAADETPAPAAAGTEGAAAVQQTSPQVAAAAPTARQRSEPAEHRLATVTSRIEHDGETYAEGDGIILTEVQFAALHKAGALAEASWDDCEVDLTLPAGWRSGSARDS